MSCTPTDGGEDSSKKIDDKYDAWEVAFSADINLVGAVPCDSNSATFTNTVKNGAISGTMTINGTFTKTTYQYSMSHSESTYTYNLSLAFDNYLNTSTYISGVAQEPALTGSVTLTGSLKGDYTYTSETWTGAGWDLVGSLTVSGALEGQALVSLHYTSDEDWSGLVQAAGIDWNVQAH
jgi:hypothetical protein